MRSGRKQWLHPADALLKGHILYTVKFLGECAVDQPKGLDVVKDAICKMKFSKHIKRAEGHKPPKVELIISADAVKVIDPKTKVTMHQCPLHRISYCADDKSDKRMFTFIAKAATSEQHYCYVFDSEKCAEEITLTIGQAFDLAYKKFLELSSFDQDLRKQLLLLNQQVQSLQSENDALKKRISELERMKDKVDIEEYMRTHEIKKLSEATVPVGESSTEENQSEHQILPQASVVGRRLENLVFQERAETNGRQVRKDNSVTPALSPPPANTRAHRAHSHSGAFGGQTDPFGMPAFSAVAAASPSSSGGQPVGDTGHSEQDLMDIRANFSRGLSFGTDDFSIDDLDPLNQKP